MELFFSRDIDGSVCRLDADESAHCVKVLRHREGDGIHVIDGEGTLYTCRILSASPKEVEAQVTGVERDWGAHPYRLRMAVCPTKNTDRYEWFAEKATEMGLDVITPVIGDHSERKVFKTDRLKRILLSASKQSLKGVVPAVDEPMPLSELIRYYSSPSSALPRKTSCSAGPLPSDDGPLPLMMPRVAQFSETSASRSSSGTVAVVAVASNSSLCGGFNGNVIREVKSRINALKTEGRGVEVISVGKKVADPLRKAGYPSPEDWNELVAHPSYAMADDLAKRLQKAFDDDPDKAIFFFQQRWHMAT